MARNVALVSRREIIAHRRLVNGVTASVPAYSAVDTAGNKEWVVDVYIGPLQGESILKAVPIVPAAKNLITDIRQPVQLERSKQGKYTVVGRAKVMSAGVQTPEGTILEPTFREYEVNLAELRLTHVADLDYSVSVYQADPGQEYQADPEQAFQQIAATDAFGHPVLGPDAEADPCGSADAVSLTPIRYGKTRHVRIAMAKYGPKGDPLAMSWGDPTKPYQPAVQEVIELQD
jgi:hypothetical protein